MNMKRAVCTLVTITTMVLAGCGGGGGGSSPMSSNNMNDTPTTPTTPTVMSLTESQLYGDIAKYGEVANNGTNFGSITQSSNGNNGISTDRVETVLKANGELTVIVRDGSGDVSLELDSSQHEIEDLNGTVWTSDSETPTGWSRNAWVLSKNDTNNVVLSVAYTLWENSDITNYLAGGYWIKANGTDVTEMGTFGDAGTGSVFSYYDEQNSPWQRPITGTATYLGDAEGAYTEDGDAGVWWGELKLNANFATNSINGCVGCSEVNDTGIYTYTTIDDLKKDNYTRENLYISLGGTNNINNDGSFNGTLELVNYDTNSPVSSSQGKWGGLFSENTGTTSTPAYAAGTLAGTAGTTGFIGVLAGSQP